MGFALRDQKKPDEAVAALRKAVAIDRTQAYATYGLGRCLLSVLLGDPLVIVPRWHTFFLPARMRPKMRACD